MDLKRDLNSVMSDMSNTFDTFNAAFKDNADPILLDYTISEMHCIDTIARVENPNVTKISKALKMTRGGTSKLVRKLMARGAISAYRNSANKKEIYYKLTDSGMAVFKAHEKIHRKWQKKNEEFFKDFSDAEIDAAINFIRKYTEFLNKAVSGFKWKSAR